jgi:adenosylcobinamide-phosphate synthase
MTALLVLAAVVLDTLLGEPRRFHPLVGFGRWAQFLEKRLNVAEGSAAVGSAAGRSAVVGPPVADGGGGTGTAGGTSPWAVSLALRLRGILAVIIAIGPWVALIALGNTISFLHYALAVAALYFALGHQSLRQHALRVHEALQAGNLADARVRVGYMVSRDTGSMDVRAVAAATVESVLENGNDAVFGALFWFLVAGAPGVLLFRLANTLDAMWGYRTPRFLYFGWAAARFDDVLNFVPARLTATTYALIGSTANALRCWRVQARAWDSPNAGPVMAAGAGALKLGLGGGAYYHGQWEERPVLGSGAAPDANSITAALRLVRSGVALWVLIVVAVEVALHA